MPSLAKTLRTIAPGTEALLSFHSSRAEGHREAHQLVLSDVVDTSNWTEQLVCRGEAPRFEHVPTFESEIMMPKCLMLASCVSIKCDKNPFCHSFEKNLYIDISTYTSIYVHCHASAQVSSSLGLASQLQSCSEAP